MILAFDVGGTKIDAGAFRRSGGGKTLQTSPVSTKQFRAGDVSDFADVVASVFSNDPSEPVTAIALAVAGPIDRTLGRVQLTNLPWSIDFADLSRQFNQVPVIAYNDLEALAWGTLCLGPGDSLTLQKGSGERTVGNRAVIAAGTGLGEAIVIWDGEQYVPVATEGGHGDFGPADDEDFGILQLARRRFGAHVSWERIVSGVFGLPLLLDFYSDGGKLLSSAWKVPALSAIVLDYGDFPWGAAIGERADAGDPIGAKVLKKFCWLYGAEAGNLALKCMATGGVYVGGGIGPKIQKWMTGGDFLAGFQAKGRFASLMSRLPVVLLTTPGLTLRGAAFGAASRLRL